MAKSEKGKVKRDGGKARAKSAPRENYHHGHLRQALLAAAESVISEKGVSAFSLREAARRAGVSPAAPAHHFGDATGLLTALAREGFIEFAERLSQAAESAGSNPSDRLRALCLAYVDFALQKPTRLQLMFQNDLINCKLGDFEKVASAAFNILADAIRALRGLSPGEQLSPADYGALLATWSMVHGFSQLALGQQFDGAAASLGGRKAIVEKMLPAMLEYLPDSAGPKAARQ